MYKNFEEILADNKDICQSSLNITNKTRTSIYSWNGQFSPQFIEVLLEKYSQKDDVVIDPFMGSGTTLIECARKNISVSGIELNPSAFYMSKSFEICNLSEHERFDIISDIEVVVTSIATVDNIIIELKKLVANSNENVQNTVSLLIILMDLFNNEISIELLNKKWTMLKTNIFQFPFSSKKITATNGDTRKTVFKDNTFTLLITSPPYINVFNYHQKYRCSVEMLGFDVLTIAKCEFGSNRKHRGNRVFTVIQYCIDIALAFKEWQRICVADARFIIVVGRESNVLSMSFSNSKLVYQLACEIFEFDFLLKQERVFKNRFGKMIFEDILHFKNNKINLNFSNEELIKKAKIIALRVLNEKKLIYADESQKIKLLDDAIKNVSKICKSEEIYND
ncbi:hypothetical protein AN639_06495 [Candidatus Epulonipiscium fishelsonii]|uniref:Uncharacterized protein n=1 Tax=Candidatus Epulonipiscium fishelsonii TaxID=77094 RepID=A0ACC8XFR0_9FIRM|nr:hypothetical protein AN639_06495 [Epulopiscium sp. SCG-B05WGA-EpuloA1]ONI42245.1 hypothetical protein AN396_01985 [Epulopiscium sp. SCG-B11WGA-EpuloA1]